MPMTSEEKKLRHRLYMREYARKNRAVITARTRARRAADPEKFRRAEKEARERNADRIKDLRRLNRERDCAKQREWRKNNRDKVRVYKQRDYFKNVERSRSRQREKYAANRDHARALAKKYYRTHKDRISALAKIDRLKNPEKYKRWRDTARQKHRAKYILYGIKRKCKNDNLEFDLTAEWLQARLDAGTCEMSGLPFDFKQKRGPSSPSVDRIKPGGPYTRANCRVILWFLNRALSNLGEDFALKAFAASIQRRENGFGNSQE